MSWRYRKEKCYRVETETTCPCCKQKLLIVKVHMHHYYDCEKEDRDRIEVLPPEVLAVSESEKVNGFA